MSDRKQTTNQTIVSQYLSKYPNHPTASLARLAYRDNDDVWPNYEAARTAFRRARGNSGAYARRTLADKTHVRKNGNSGVDPFSLIPQGRVEMPNWGPYKMRGKRKVLILGDVHVPFHHNGAFELALREGVEAGCTDVICLGDFMDFYSVSRWIKDPRERDMAGELKAGFDCLTAIRMMFPTGQIVYKVGNHEDRMSRYMSLKAPELIGVDAFEIQELLHFDVNDITCVNESKPIKLGSLNLLHGHEFGAVSTAVNPARGLYMRANANSMIGHYHRSSHHSESALDGRTTSCWSIGCLCDLRPAYMPINKWNHGYAIVTIDENDAFSVDNRRIIDGKSWG